jgi:hypothetical protein
VIYEHGEPWWNDVDRGILLICPPERSLAVLLTEPSSSKSGGSGKGNDVEAMKLQNVCCAVNAVCLGAPLLYVA